MFIPKDTKKRSQSDSGKIKDKQSESTVPSNNVDPAEEEVSKAYFKRVVLMLMKVTLVILLWVIHTQARRLARELRDFDELLATREYEKRTSGDRWGKGGR